ncbi:hypothetical protein D4739_15335 [Nocardioides cavernaquae]|uniref:Uncharacterized protein n=1 Tax=Nocardioides cavernaquae TaxID=2321396 RepID=A0A3A5HA07_9ACTN|nr:hypothetical protein D4739_15335 [Nocardioides cavernaquae]
MSIEQLEAASLIRSAVRAANDAADSLGLVMKCLVDAESAHQADAGRVRYLVNELVDDLNRDLLSRQDATSNVRWL